MIDEIHTGGVSIPKCGYKWITSPLGINTTDNETTESRDIRWANKNIVFFREIRYSYIDDFKISTLKLFKKY
jgi:hypothetical protein